MTTLSSHKHSPAASSRHRPTRNWLVPLISLLAGGSLLGLSTNLAKLAGQAQLSPLAFLFWSVAGAALVLLGVSAMRGQLPPITLRSVEYYNVSAFVGVAGANLLFFSAIEHVGAGFVALTITLPPLLTYVGALALRMEGFQLLRAVGVACALAGTLVLALKKLSAPDANHFWILLTLAGPVLLAIGNLYRTMRWPQGASGSALAPGMLIAATIMLFGMGLIPGFSISIPTDQKLPLFLISTQALVFAGQFWLLFILQRTGGPVLLSLLGSVGAAIGVPVAVLLQGETPPEGLLLGILLIGTGITLLNFNNIRNPKIH